MRTMADGEVDITITSPPYTSQRTYSIGFALTGQGWVDWCIPRIVEMCRVTAGIVFFNAAGPVKDFKYQPVVEWLVADLTRKHGIVCGPAPYVFHRVGIPGSGGPHYHRRDWEPVYCFALPCNLPPRWSDNTATGKPPKWAPGGEMSSRKTNGERVNQVKGDRTGETTGGKGVKAFTRRKANGKRGEPAGTATSGHKNSDTQTVDGIYLPPVLANSGNVIHGQLSFEELWSVVLNYANATNANPDKILWSLQKAISNQALQEWLHGIDYAVLGAKVLQSGVHGRGNGERRHVGESSGEQRLAERQGQVGSNSMLTMRSDEARPSSPHRRESDEQRERKLEGTLPLVSSERAYAASSDLPDLWQSGETVQALRTVVRQALPEIQAAWKSVFESDRNATLPETYPGPRIIHCKVGGGVMGSKIAHESEAPFPESLVRFFIVSYCPPGGTVLDPFSGSGTTCSVAIQENRNAIGIDIRDGEGGIASARKRLEGVTPATLFS